MPGAPDIIGQLTNGIILCIECKSAKGLLSSAQKNFQNRVLTNHGQYIIARSQKTLGEALERLAGENNQRSDEEATTLLRQKN
jgi:Holliday junction resolvase